MKMCAVWINLLNRWTTSILRNLIQRGNALSIASSLISSPLVTSVLWLCSGCHFLPFCQISLVSSPVFSNFSLFMIFLTFSPFNLAMSHLSCFHHFCFFVLPTPVLSRIYCCGSWDRTRLYLLSKIKNIYHGLGSCLYLDLCLDKTILQIHFVCRCSPDVDVKPAFIHLKGTHLHFLNYSDHLCLGSDLNTARVISTHGQLYLSWTVSINGD